MFPNQFPWASYIRSQKARFFAQFEFEIQIAGGRIGIYQHLMLFRQLSSNEDFSDCLSACQGYESVIWFQNQACHLPSNQNIFFNVKIWMGFHCIEMDVIYLIHGFNFAYNFVLRTFLDNELLLMVMSSAKGLFSTRIVR